MQKTQTGVFVLLVTGYCCMAQTATTNEGRDPAMPETAIVTSNRPEFIPMTQVERVRYYFKSTFNSTSVLTSAAGSGITQWENSPKEWKQGAEGYGMRVGNSYAQHIIRQTMMFGASSVLHEDNRYLPSGQSGFGPRLKYAIASTLLARRDDGGRRLSFSRIGGTAGAAFVSRRWQPHSTNTTGDAATSFGISMGSQAGMNVAREFLSDVLHRHRSDKL